MFVLFSKLIFFFKVGTIVMVCEDDRRSHSGTSSLLLQLWSPGSMARAFTCRAIMLALDIWLVCGYWLVSAPSVAKLVLLRQGAISTYLLAHLVGLVPSAPSYGSPCSLYRYHTINNYGSIVTLGIWPHSSSTAGFTEPRLLCEF